MKRDSARLTPLDYIKALAEEWKALITGGTLAVAFFVVGAIDNSYFGWQSVMAYAVIGLAFIQANYLAWKKQKEITQDIQKQLEGQTDTRPQYEIKATTRPVNSSVDIAAELAWIKAEMERAAREIGQQKQPAKNPYSVALAFASEPIPPSQWRNYIEDLEQYKTDLSTHVDMVTNTIKYTVIDIKNTGKASGTNLDIKLVPADDGTFLYSLPKPPSRPDAPKSKNAFLLSMPNRLSIYGDNTLLDFTPRDNNDSNMGLYRKINTSKAGVFDVSINRIHAGQGASLRRDGFYLKKHKYPFEITCSIHSTELEELKAEIIIE